MTAEAGWEMSDFGPRALLQVDGFGTVLATWPDGGHCGVKAYGSGKDSLALGVISFKDEDWFVRQDLVAAAGWEQEKGRRQRAVSADGDTSGTGRRTLPAAAQERLNRAIVLAVTGFLAVHQDVTLHADRLHLEQELDRQIAATTRLSGDLEAAKKRLSTLAGQLSAVQGLIERSS